MVPPAVAALADELAALPGVVAVVLGGSRATGRHRPDSDWDLGVYYRGAFDAAEVRALGHPGHVSELGEWGPVVNGGAWLTLDGTPVDVLYRDLDVVERWTEDAAAGRYEVLLQNGYLAGAPTYLVAGELALCVHLAGDVPRPAFSDALVASAPERWRGRASVALLFARDAEPVIRRGLLTQATVCVAHARMAERREWVLNEKGLLARAGLEDAGEDVAAVGAALGVEPLTIR